ncbi:uncharacterized protein LOC128922137 [Zeugodacus cucurbitae]|uniref:uncharacterized protein LOC128922137 n=1 Tax=Zeugodacus cucurbitae TaxID=28588 RepID=UPI0023D9594B|nr:uncharacterized protein LOC128922137 [Zeugodacus cucurbitae]
MTMTMHISGIIDIDIYANIRMIIALAVEYKLHLHQMDVSSAYLNSELHDEVYMKQPECFMDRKSGRPKALTPYEERNAIVAVKRNPRISAVKITNNINVEFKKNINPQTVRNVLHKAGYYGRTARHGVIKVWRRANAEMQENNLIPTVKHGGGNIMVWGCMAASGVGNLEFITDKMDKYMYLNILKKNLRPSVQKLGLDSSRFLFQQDNDPKHTSYLVREWLLYNCKQLQTPPQSPDINPIEHIWDLLKKKDSKT